jgi:hypothetical protein
LYFTLSSNAGNISCITGANQIACRLVNLSDVSLVYKIQIRMYYFVYSSRVMLAKHSTWKALLNKGRIMSTNTCQVLPSK